MSVDASATIRMYRLSELGDCFLITFVAGPSTSRILIDCGSFRNNGKSIARLQQITGDIVQALNGAAMDVIVGTHQHNDHLSGFVHCEQVFRDRIAVEQVWLSWLDNPQDQHAQSIGDHFHNVASSLHAAHRRLHQSPVARRNLQSVERLGDILGFYGVKGASTPPELPATAVKILREIGRKKPQYLYPGHVFDMPGLPSDSVRIYVLGPPQETTQLYDKDPSAGESYDKELGRASAASGSFLNAVQAQRGSISREEEHFPFNERTKRRSAQERSSALRKVVRSYRRRAAAWRRIDDDWLEQAESLALFLDTYTNNSSLVMAFELVKSGKVLLFAADAQTGNWSSWSSVTWDRPGVSADDLLSRTVFYKVGHHGSHNATLVQAFERMSPELVALIPVHKQDPNITKPNGWKMPARNLLRRIKERTANRVLQMDNVNPPSCNPKKEPAKSSWGAVGITPKVTPLYVEVTIKG